jgi:hypothetical protein
MDVSEPVTAPQVGNHAFKAKEGVVNQYGVRGNRGSCSLISHLQHTKVFSIALREPIWTRLSLPWLWHQSIWQIKNYPGFLGDLGLAGFVNLLFRCHG